MPLSTAAHAKLVTNAEADPGTWCNQLRLHAPADAARLCPESPAREGPGLLARAATFGAAVARHVAHGCPAADAAEKGRRLALCVVCPDYRSADGTCGRCGCVLAVKAAWAGERCPRGLW